MSDSIVLSLKNITKRYHSVVALDNVSIDFRKGEVHCIVGENGAGKSTLIKTISGAIEPDEGNISVFGKTYNAMTPHLSRKLGIEVIYQELNLADELTVAENVFLGRKFRKKGMVDMKATIEKAAMVFNHMQVKVDPHSVVSNLSVSYMQFVEIAKAIAMDVKILIMDEPTAPLTEDEVDKLMNLVMLMKAQGVTIIYISHRLNEIFRIGDRYTVMRDGQKIITGDVKDTTMDELVTHMVGREMKKDFPQRTHELGDVILEARHIYSEKVHDISFYVRKGEILGIGGLVGAGRTETVRAVFGADPLYAGEILFEGKHVTIRNPKEATALGIGFVSEDRKRQGLLLDHSIRFNISLPILKKLSKFWIVDKKQEVLCTDKQKYTLNIKTPTLDVEANSLSGGNQQKVVLAKWLAADCKVIIMDEPTRGIDVGAKQEVYKLMNELVNKGIAIIMISSEMEELLGMSDRLLIMREGCQVTELKKEQFSQELVMKYASNV
jgi:ribose transport system ATP-binding protein